MAPFSFPNGVKIGSRYGTICTILSGSPPIDFSWFKDGNPITASHLDIIRSKSSSTLDFDGIRSEDAGEYKCIVKNAVGSAFHSAKLVIEGELIT